jgi:peptidoglycan-associated lipoprotein
MRRAKAIFAYLTKAGVDKKLLTVKSLGKSAPVCTDHNEACWQKNRNVTFKF